MGEPPGSSGRGRIGETLIESERLHERVAELGAEISADYGERDLVMVGVLKGALIFMADLMRSLTIPCEIDLMAVSSYGSATDSSGVVRILKDLDTSIAGRDVLIVEDIVDSGLTLQYLLRNLRARDPASIEVCALLTKPERRRVDTPIRYVGFEIPDRFAIGYGLDHAQRYRNLDYVAELDAGVAAGSRPGRLSGESSLVRSAIRSRPWTPLPCGLHPKDSTHEADLAQRRPGPDPDRDRARVLRAADHLAAAAGHGSDLLGLHRPDQQRLDAPTRSSRSR